MDIQNILVIFQLKVYVKVTSIIFLKETYIHNFISMLLNIEKGGVIAIDGEWGSGKTYFVHQVKWLLDCIAMKKY